MKSNKKGWGLATMIVFMSILLAFLLVTVIMVYNFYRYSEVVKSSNQEQSEPQINNNQDNTIQKYKLYENRLKRNAITYAYSYYLNLDEYGQKVTLEEMIEKDIMSTLIDPEDGTPCTGYAIVKLENDKIASTPYLKCNNYVSANYDDN